MLLCKACPTIALPLGGLWDRRAAWASISTTQEGGKGWGRESNILTPNVKFFNKVRSMAMTLTQMSGNAI